MAVCRLSDSSDGQTSDGAHKHAFPYSYIAESMMSRAHGQQELPCNSWVGKFLRNLGLCLNIKRQVGVLLGEHRGWILRMAFSYNAKIFRTTAFFSLFQHTAFYFPPPAKGWRSILSLQRGKRAACFPLAELLNSYIYTREHSASPLVKQHVLHRPENPFRIFADSKRSSLPLSSLQRRKLAACSTFVQL